MLERNLFTQGPGLGPDTSQTGTLYSGILMNSGVLTNSGVILYSGFLVRSSNEMNKALCVCVQESRELLVWTSFILSFMTSVYTSNSSKTIYIISHNSPTIIPGKTDFTVSSSLKWSVCSSQINIPRTNLFQILIYTLQKC